MKDQIVVVTGANSGIGKETAKALAAKGATVVMACRNPERASAALDEIRGAVDGAAVEVMALDLASLASIRAFATAFQARFDRLDVLVNNAGLIPMTKQSTVDGFEMQIGVNHLGHVLLTQLLRPQLAASDRKRVVVVASMMHSLGHIDFESFRGEKRYNMMKAYGQSKLANVLFAREFARRATDGVSAFSLHPGGVATNIAGRSVPRRLLYRLFGGFLTPERGARTSVFLASEPTLDAPSGSYFDHHCRVRPGSSASRDEAVARRLWDVSEGLVGEGQA